MPACHPFDASGRPVFKRADQLVFLERTWPRRAAGVRQPAFPSRPPICQVEDSRSDKRPSRVGEQKLQLRAAPRAALGAAFCVPLEGA